MLFLRVFKEFLIHCADKAKGEGGKDADQYQTVAAPSADDERSEVVANKASGILPKCGGGEVVIRALTGGQKLPTEPNERQNPEPSCSRPPGGFCDK